MIHIPKDAINTELAKYVTVVDVTPELAEKWLAHNTHNRNPKRSKSAQYADDMTYGRWSFNGEPIQFADDGTLLNGQNRLLAVVESGITVPFVVVWNLPFEAQDDMDTGALRKFSDVLTMKGEVNTATLASLIRFCKSWETGDVRSAMFAGNLSISSGLRYLDRNPEMRELTNWAMNHRAGPLSPTLMGGLYWACSRVDDDHALEDAEFFFDRLVDGQGLLQTDHIYILRKALETRATAGSSTRRTRSMAAALTIKAWNAYRDGEPINVLSWRQGGANPESFPEPH